MVENKLNECGQGLMYATAVILKYISFMFTVLQYSGQKGCSDFPKILEPP